MHHCHLYLFSSFLKFVTTSKRDIMFFFPHLLILNIQRDYNAVWVNNEPWIPKPYQLSYTFFLSTFPSKTKTGKSEVSFQHAICVLMCRVVIIKKFFWPSSAPLSSQTHNNHHSRTKIDAHCSPLVPNEEEKPQRNDDGGTHTYILHPYRVNPEGTRRCSLSFSHLVLNISTWLAFTIIIIINSVLSLAMSLSLSSSSFQQEN